MSGKKLFDKSQLIKQGLLIMHLKPTIQSFSSCSGCSQKHLIGFFKGCWNSVVCTTWLLLFQIVLVIKFPAFLVSAYPHPLFSKPGLAIWLGCSPDLDQLAKPWSLSCSAVGCVSSCLTGPPGRLWRVSFVGGSGMLLAPAAYLHLRKVSLAMYQIRLHVNTLLVELGLIVHFQYCASGSTSQKAIILRRELRLRQVFFNSDFCH